ncbi:sensor histidine kinase [Pseudochrobactrum kiredjianiae]|uniref:histidine kinase n=1 Tax=Pseudochrobactrum kiredjianiae TaxID=386305 RepID=A0ABW3V706_9HYPH|nr:PAS domain-containing sensor histidine kinase [Pseudochrobactrum kiredjianiae]MDM7849589.1 ATP-binding protein [Pseudochrobactrum kiredjianiae]
MSGVSASGNKGSAISRNFRKALAAAASFFSLFSANAGFAQSYDIGRIPLPGGSTLGPNEVVQFAIVVGVTGAALLSVSWIIRSRNRVNRENSALRARVADLSHAVTRSETLLNLKDQRIVVWAGAEPAKRGASQNNMQTEVLGQLPVESGAPQDVAAFLSFGRWLRTDSVVALERAILSLREYGRSFDFLVETNNGTMMEVQGQTTGAYAITRFINVDGVQARAAHLQMQNNELSDTLTMLHALLNRLDQTVWTRDVDGRLNWANNAYVQAVGATNLDQVLQEGRELLGEQARQKIERERVLSADGASQNQQLAVPLTGQQGASIATFRDRLATVIGGDRHMLDVAEVSCSAGSAGFAANMSDLEQVRAELQRTLRSHAETLDQLSTAVAIFDPEMKLQFFNQAFAKLWSLDIAYLESRPSNAMLFDGLRSDGKLPEQPEWRRWKESMLSAYRAVDPQEHWWHLPDSRTLRVVANPHPQGGVTWFFENMTEKFDLESRYNTLMKVQGETLDHLAEGVVVFGADGRIRLSNPAFAELWSIPPTIAVEGTHISVIRKQCKELADDRYWDEFVSAVTGIADKREGAQGQAELSTGTILSYAVVPLPKGQMMLTFVDVSDTAHVERALKDKNEALELADQIKNDFVQHVSYELRSPLTNIIGFTELLQTPGFGELNNRQREYVEHISTSSLTLLTIVNDILDLATVDAGIMELDVSDVVVREAVTAASERVADRLREHDIALKVKIEDADTSFRGDANRVHQVLFNLLSNAANYAPEGSEIDLDIRRRDDHIVFSVHDNGPGMPKEVLDTVFKRFQSHSNGGRRRGAGLGLSLVKSFVELHGGTVDIRTAPSSGTTVLVRFPLDARIYRAAAE